MSWKQKLSRCGGINEEAPGGENVKCTKSNSPTAPTPHQKNTHITKTQTNIQKTSQKVKFFLNIKLILIIVNV